MSIRFNRKLFAILISAIALLSIATAKDYSITAGNWQVDFRTNDTYYTETERRAAEDNEASDYGIWIQKDPAGKGLGAFIILNDFAGFIPYNKDSMKSYANDTYSAIYKSPILSDYLIDGRYAAIIEGWSENVGQIGYGAIYTVDQNGYASRAVIFNSFLDKKTTFEILDSLHVEYTGSIPTQMPASTTGYNGANQGGSTITTDGLLTTVKQIEPSIDKISMMIGTTNIDVSFTEREGSTKSENINALSVIIQMYAYILKLDPTYNGYLRISQKEKGREIAIYEAIAYETRENTDATGALSTNYINQVLSSGKSITYSTYMSDGYGDVTKAVDVPGGRAGPSQESWL